MIGNLFWLLICVGVLVAFARQPRIGAVCYLLAVLFAPYANVADRQIRVELVLVPLLLGLLAVGHRLRLPAPLLPFIAWAGLVATVSLAYEGESNLIELYGTMRFVAVLLIFSSIQWREHDFVRTQYIFVLTAIPMAIFAAGQALWMPWAAGLTDLAYHSTNRIVFDQQLDNAEQGYGFRAIGVFENVSPAAMYFVTALAVGTLLFLTVRRSANVNHGTCGGQVSVQGRGSWRYLRDLPTSRLLVGLAAAIGGGLSTLSATFFAGSVVGLSGGALLCPTKRRGLARGLVVMAAPAMVAVAVWQSGQRLDSLSAQFQYQWERVVNGTFFESRYGRGDAVLGDAIKEIAEEPLLGHGIKVTQTFRGDSLYVWAVYVSGYLGSLLLFGGVANCAVLSLRQGLPGRVALLWTLVVCTCGLGCVSLLAFRFGDWWWATQGMIVSIVQDRTLAASAGPARKASTCLGRGPCVLPRQTGSGGLRSIDGGQAVRRNGRFTVPPSCRQ